MRENKRVRSDTEKPPLDPFLVLVATTLFAFLAIAEIDRHRDVLSEWGVNFNNEAIDASFLGP